MLVFAQGRSDGNCYTRAVRLITLTTCAKTDPMSANSSLMPTLSLPLSGMAVDHSPVSQVSLTPLAPMDTEPDLLQPDLSFPLPLATSNSSSSMPQSQKIHGFGCHTFFYPDPSKLAISGGNKLWSYWYIFSDQMVTLT